MSPSNNERRPSRITLRPVQFRLGTLLLAITAVAVAFGVLNWLGMSEAVGYFVLAVICVAAAATAGLVLALLQAYAASAAAQEISRPPGNDAAGGDPLAKESPE